MTDFWAPALLAVCNLTHTTYTVHLGASYEPPLKKKEKKEKIAGYTFCAHVYAKAKAMSAGPGL